MVSKKGGSLIIISHTPHFLDQDIIYGWGPTVKEINSLINLFDKIIHIAPLHAGPAPKTTSEYAKGIIYRPVPVSGGNTFFDKLLVFKVFRVVKSILSKEMTSMDTLHIRLPMGLGNVLLPYLKFSYSKDIWFKYAGNLDQDNPPIGYLFQRYLLNNFFKKSIVTCNGVRINISFDKISISAKKDIVSISSTISNNNLRSVKLPYANKRIHFL